MCPISLIKPLVAVRWLDAHGSGTTAYAEHEIPHAGIEITTYGILLLDDPLGVSVANEWCADNTWRGYTFVPRGMVIEVTPVIPVRKKRSPRHPQLTQALVTEQLQAGPGGENL